VKLTFTHASDYLIVIDEGSTDSTESPGTPENPGTSERPEEPGSSDGAESTGGGAVPLSPQTGEGQNSLAVIAMGFLSLLIGAGMFLRCHVPDMEKKKGK
jgi:LPXTG-motif cell wall-anchored protein